MAATEDEMKRRAAQAAVAEVEHGMVIGLGTGTTAAFAVVELGRRRLDVTTVATSLRTDAMAREAGLRVVDFATIGTIDMAIDGADQLDGTLRAIKGGGGAMLREKIVAAAARRMICIVDAGKQVMVLGARPLPIEVLPFAAEFVRQEITALGAIAAWRKGFRTDQGNPVLDCSFGSIHQPDTLVAALDAIPGVLGHGLFLSEIDEAFVGTSSGVLRLSRGGK